MKEIKYKVTNTTIKPPRICPETKKDLRTVMERVGHSITFNDSTGRKHMLTQRRSAIISEINQGILSLSEGGYASVEKISDIAEVLRPHVAKTTVRKDPGSPMPKLNLENDDLAQAEETADFGEPKSNHGSSRRAHAVEMGLNVKSSDITESDAINPDGRPNFAVTAKHNAKPRREK